MEQDLLNRLTSGLFVLTANYEGRDNGCITSTAIQLTADPLRISVAVNKNNLTCKMIDATKKFTISVLSESAPFDVFKRFGFQSGRDVDKFAGYTECKRASNGRLIVTAGTNAYMSVEVVQQVDFGSHILFVGKPSEGEILNGNPSLTYAYYLENIKPKPEKRGVTQDGQTIWKCTVCGYEYVGEEMPVGFLCPVCKHPICFFEKV